MNAKDIFLDAIELPPEQRTSYIVRACGSNIDLEAAVRELIRVHEQAGDFLPGPPAVAAPVSLSPALPDDPRPGDAIDRYELVREIGQGGFGTVYLARQFEPVQRLVALKLIRAGMDSRQVIQRFEAERQTLAILDHPNIARVFDAGETEVGEPYFVMEYVDGLPITTFCDQRRLGIRQRLALLEKVCLAVQHAHTRGIIHRDLKPSNILVAEVDGEFEPKVIDFGVAKATDTRMDLAPDLTHELQIVGTPQYMSPEQATTGPARLVDTRSDVYSLGTILYELMAGTPPFAPAELRDAGFDQICRIIRDQTPVKPSTRVGERELSKTLTRTIGTEGTQIRRQLRGEVDWIVMKALEKEPGRRYQSASELAADIRRHLTNRAVLAGPPSVTYQLRKFAGRHRIQLAAASIVLLALVGTAIISAVMASRARAAEARALDAADRARAAESEALQSAEQAKIELNRAFAIANFAHELLGGISPSVAQGRDVTVLKEMLDRAVASTEGLRSQPVIEIVVRSMIAQAFFDLGDTNAAIAQVLPMFDSFEGTVDHNHMERWRAGVSLVSYLRRAGRFEEAERIARQVLQGFASNGELASVQGRAARSAAAGILIGRGKYVEARSILELLLADCRAAGDESSDTFIHASNSLAMCHSAMKEPEIALRLWEQLLPLQVKVQGTTNQATLGTMNNIAATLGDLGRRDEAETMYREMLEIERRIYQPGHPNLVKSLSNLGAMLLSANRIDEASAFVEEAYRTAPLQMDPTHSFRNATNLQYMRLRERQERWADAVEAGRALQESYHARFGRDDMRSIAMAGFRLVALAKVGEIAEGLEIIAHATPERLSPMPVESIVSFHAQAGLFFLEIGREADARQRAELAQSLIPEPTESRPRWSSSSLLALQRRLDIAPPTTSPATQPAR